MGTDYSVYVGPYFVCKTVKVDKKSSITSCTNSSCKEYEKPVYDSGTKFCSKCGAKIGKVQVTVKRENVDDEEIREKVNERLTIPFCNCGEYVEGATLWLPNVGDLGESFDPRSDDGQIELDDNTVKSEKKQLLKDFAKEYDILCDAYGKDNIEVKYGILSQIW